MSNISEKRWAFLMLVAESVALYTMLNTVGMPMVLCAIAFCGILLGFSFALSSFRLVVLCTVMLLYLYVRDAFFPLTIGQATHTFGEFGTILAEYSMLVQAVLLFWRREGGTSIVFGLFGGLVMMSAGDHGARGWEYPVYQTTVLVYVVCLAMVMAGFRARSRLVGVQRGSAVVVAVTLLAITFSSAGASFGLYYYQHELDAAFVNMAYPVSDMGGTRLDDEVSLGSIAEAQAEGRTAVALRIESEGSPGYMRANVFDTYASPEWTSSSPMRDVQPTYNNESTGLRRYPLESLSVLKRPDEHLEERLVWPVGGAGTDVFTQLDTAFVELDRAALSADLHGTAYSRERRAASPYRLYVDTKQRGAPMPEELRQDYLRVPASIGPEIRATAVRLFEGVDRPDAKALRVKQYFQENYTYKIGIQVPPGEEPLNYFVREQAAAHCEYFASVTAILLRLGGVPTRYVTGYVALERNSVNGYWLARSRDAHAWVEMWDGEQWVIVESTPVEGIPLQGLVTESDHAWDAWKLKWQKWREALLSGQAYRWVLGQAQAFLEWLRGFVLSPVGIMVIVGAMALFGLRTWLRRRRGPREAVQHVDDLGALLRDMERWLGQYGWFREGSETLTQFAARLDADIGLSELDGPAIAQWYREYVALRYDPHTKAGERMKALEAQLRALLEQEVMAS